jgi:hypothetical protein
MAAQDATVEKQVRKGVNDENVTHYFASYTGTWASADTMVIDTEGYEIGAYIPCALACWTDGAGDPGARARTLKTAAHVPLTSFDEATGKIVATNSSGAGIVNPKFMVTLIATP